MTDKLQNEVVVQKDKQLPDIEVSEITIKNLIHMIRGQQVMLDSDLAMLYQVETKNLNKAMKRNINRFPEDFCFQLTEAEYKNLRCQIGTSSLDGSGYGGRRYLPYAFTEQGISMLSAVLRSEIAINVSIGIMRAFVEMRRFLASNALMFDRINEIEVKQLEYQKSTEVKFDKIFQYISEHEESTQKIFFDGQIYDAFGLLVNLVAKAEKKIVLIDNRFLIIDDSLAYHIGASVKDAGKKCFGINFIEDSRIVRDILERLKLEANEVES